MRLKSLELVGFKSFLEPTVITFSPGITAVVGPNGCGKSNVVDAIRWVLGEQAPTRLRGKSTEDLIYAGNESHQPAGLAEVTLLLAAAEGDTLPEPCSTLSEVAVTRRVYRSGDSEYLINKIPCRLKDITEFFMAAQIHSRGYALVEQGRIDEIIQAKPAELRTMVEEAAGLSLFKGRREISERKLERVRENLARVDDVLSEIERQLNFARRQAKKAEAYKLVRGELAELEKLTAARRLIEQHSELAAQSAQEIELREKAGTVRAQAAALQDEAELAAQALAALRDELANAGRELENLTAAFEERARTRTFLERRLNNLNELAPGLSSLLIELDAKAVAVRAARAMAGARLAREARDENGANEAALSALRNQHEASERIARQHEKRVEDLKDEVADLMREVAVVQGRLGDLSGERSELDSRLHALADNAPQLAAEAQALKERTARAQEMVAAARNEVIEREGVQRETTEQEIRLRSDLERQTVALSTARDDYSRALAAARPLAPNGAGQRLRSVLESLNGDRPLTDPKMLLDVVKAPPALEPALRAVLGEQLDAVIVESPRFALRAVEILKENQAGRLSFVPASMEPSVRHETMDAPGIAGRLLEMVEVEPRFAPMVEALMGHVMVADNLRSAYAAANLNGNGTVFVTRDGDMLWPERMITGGSGASVESDAEIDMRKRTTALEAAQRALAGAEADREELMRRCEWARVACRDEVEALNAARRNVIVAERSASEVLAAAAKTEQQLALAEANRAGIARRLDEAGALMVSANARLEELATLEQSARARLADASGELATSRAEARRLGELMLELGTRVEARKALLRTLNQELSHQRRIADELDTQINQHRAEITRLEAEREEYDRELADLTNQDRLSTERRGELEAKVAELRARCAEPESKVEQVRHALENSRAALAEIEADAVKCELRRERARTLIEELERNFQEKFQADFSSVAGDLETTLMGRDVERDEARLNELRAKAEKLGEVNLAAESEVMELEEREVALQSERADLQAAVNDLAHTIQKLNREARKRFAETFENAAKNFAELFPKLLRGGKGRIELTNADDVLEAGVDILVQPAGKKVKEIAMLSGGEKALSAMALIFSLFLLNPSPFCLMDEVDAPLDEFSLAAFTGLVKELKLRSQFIIITHNQRTMQAADHIHGVTMERPGISRIISLKIPQSA